MTMKNNLLRSTARTLFDALATLSFASLTLGCTDKPTSYWSGYAEGDYVYIAAPLAGRLESVSVSAGQMVTKEAPLFSIDAEIEQFINEGLKDHLSELKFKDNQPLRDLFDSPPLGIFNLLDESSSVASTDEALLNIIIKYHKTDENLRIPKGSKDLFLIIHTAKDVEYCITNFRIKNKDELSNELEEMMGLSSFKTISYIFRGINNFGKELLKFIDFYELLQLSN